MGIRSAAVAALVGCTVVACTGPNPEPSEPASPTPSPASSDVTTVSVGNFASLPLADFFAEYDSARPDTSILLIEESASSSFRPMVEDALRGTVPLPDVAIFDAADLPEIAASGKYSEAVALTVDPGAMCFRPELLAEAGIASSREDFAALLAENGGGWDQYFAVGRQYTAATGRAWFDGAATIWPAMAGQNAEGYAVHDRSISVADDVDLRAKWDLLGAALIDGLSASEWPWDWDGGAALADGSFATMPCSLSMRTVMQYVAGPVGADAVGEWDVADALPGGGWMAGGTYIAVATHAVAEGASEDLVAWLTDLAQQSRFREAGFGVPVEPEAQAAWAETSDGGIFADAPTGAIDVSRADVAPPHVAGIRDARLEATGIVPILDRIARGELSVEDGWAEFVAEVG